MSIKQSTTTSKESTNGIEIEEETEDLKTFQIKLDDSLKLVKNLINSWLPKDLDKSWNNDSTDFNATPSTTTSNVLLKSRPPR